MGWFSRREPRTPKVRSTELLFEYVTPMSPEHATEAFLSALAKSRTFGDVVPNGGPSARSLSIEIIGKYIHVHGGTSWRAQFVSMSPAPNGLYYPHGADGFLRLDRTKREVAGMRDEAKALAYEVGEIFNQHSVDVRFPSTYDVWE